MALAQLDAVRKVFDRVREDADPGDGELLTRYRQRRDQAAFGSLVRRHGPMVLGVCRRVLRDDHAAEDAFQVTFLVLAKRADTVRPPGRLAPWLYGVAYRTSLKARSRAFRRQQVEQGYATEVNNRSEVAPDGCTDLLPIIDEQLNALPEKYRDPLVLCGMQGLNKAEAAERLGLPEGTVSSRLARGREMLRDRLSRRGVAVPAAALATLLTADTLQAAVAPALATTVATFATGTALISHPALALSHEVLRSMTLLKLKTLCVVAMSVALTGGGFGLYALTADEKKPVQPGEKPAVKPEKPGEKPNPNEKNGQNNQQGKNEKSGNNNQNGEGDKPKPDGEKPRVTKSGGKVASVDAKENTMMIAAKGDNGIVERMFKVAADAKVFVDGKEAKLADVPKNSTAALLIAAGKEGALPTATEVRVTGSTFNGIVAKTDTTSVTLDSEKQPRVFKLSAAGKVTINGKDAKITDLKAGDKVQVTLKADESAALTIVAGTKVGDVEKPGKPGAEKNPKFSGKVASVDAATRTVMFTAKKPGGEGADKLIPVKLTADAKIVVDGKEVKIGDIPKGANATLTLIAAKDGQTREANELVVAGITFFGVIKQLDQSSVTIGGEKSDRVVKLAAGGKVMIGEKEGKLADLKVGDKVSVTLTSDESAAVMIQGGIKKPTGDKPKPEKPEQDEDQ